MPEIEKMDLETVVARLANNFDFYNAYIKDESYIIIPIPDRYNCMYESDFKLFSKIGGFIVANFGSVVKVDYKTGEFTINRDFRDNRYVLINPKDMATCKYAHESIIWKTIEKLKQEGKLKKHKAAYHGNNGLYYPVAGYGMRYGMELEQPQDKGCDKNGFIPKSA